MKWALFICLSAAILLKGCAAKTLPIEMKPPVIMSGGVLCHLTWELLADGTIKLHGVEKCKHLLARELFRLWQQQESVPKEGADGRFDKNVV